MREIKFRAIIPERNATIFFTLKDLLDNKFSNRELLWPWLKDGNQPDEYAGRKDKSRVEIYEGDICKVESLEFPETDKEKIKSIFISEIIFRFCCFEWYDGYNYWTIDQPCWRMEVIGNIYENKELLMEAKQ